MSLFDLTGRSAIVTGAAGFLGGAISHALSEAGANVALVDRVSTENLANQLPKSAKQTHKSIIADLAVDQDCRALPIDAVSSFGSLDIIVNCAAFVGTDNLQGWTSEVESQSLKTWRESLEVNLTAPFVLTQAALPYLKQSSNASVINIGSIYGVLGPDWSLYDDADICGTPAAYAAAKGGLMQMTRWLATTLAPSIRVNAIVPGGVERNTPERFKTAYASRTPLARMATEDDVIGAALFLASGASSYITGQCLMVDGGWSAW
jgi:NAD(P)-dependent dehydrogenase (short-subunit alcohol dehydrogenase family)